MENKLTKEDLLQIAAPVYSINSIDSYPLNPYRLLVHYIKTTAYDSIKHYNISLQDFYKNYNYDQRKEIFDNAFRYPDLRFEYAEKFEHDKIFFDFKFYKENIELGRFIFYTHMSYISPTKYDTKEYVAAELDFSCYNCFDFLELDSANNIFDYAKSDEAEASIDMILANIYAFYNFTDFVKYFKTKMLVVKNIQMFCEKLIKPIVTDIQLTFAPEQFMLGVLCGNNILKDVYSYDNYLQTVKNFEKNIRDKFGETYAPKEDKPAE